MFSPIVFGRSQADLFIKIINLSVLFATFGIVLTGMKHHRGIAFLKTDCLARDPATPKAAVQYGIRRDRDVIGILCNILLGILAQKTFQLFRRPSRTHVSIGRLGR